MPILLLGTATAVAAPVPFPSDPNALFACTVDHGDSSLLVLATSASGGQVSAGLAVSGTNQLAFEGFRIYSFDQREFIEAILDSATMDATTRTIKIQMSESFTNAIRINGTFTLTDQGDETIVDETVVLTNTLPITIAPSVSGRLYAITDYDLNGSAVDDSISATLSGKVTQTDGGTTATIEATGLPVNAFDVALCCGLDDPLRDIFIDLRNRRSAPGPGDFESAYVWDRVIQAGSSVTVKIRKTVTVPEPSRAWLELASLLALVSLARLRRPRFGASAGGEG